MTERQVLDAGRMRQAGQHVIDTAKADGSGDHVVEAMCPKLSTVCPIVPVKSNEYEAQARVARHRPATGGCPRM
jgi:hypothetical protein